LDNLFPALFVAVAVLVSVVDLPTIILVDHHSGASSFHNDINPIKGFKHIFIKGMEKCCSLGTQLPYIIRNTKILHG
jgi:hypothetical protein